MRISNLYILQPALVSYRVPFFESIVNRLGCPVNVMYGEHTTSKAVFSDKLEFDWAHPSPNKWFLGKRTVYQILPLQKIISAELVVLNLNPRFIHNWIILIVRRALGRSTLTWGHLYSRNGKNSRINCIRLLQVGLSHGLMVYTRTEEQEFKVHNINTPVRALGNSCVFSTDCATKVCSNPSSIDSIIYVGRLSPAKRPDLLFASFKRLLSSYPKMKLIVVGSGEEDEKLRHQYARQIENGEIVMKGWIWSREVLNTLYAKSLFSVTSGFAGLNVIQSFAYGVPTIVARDEPHSPEIEACKDGFNTEFFDKGSVESLLAAMKRLMNQKNEWIERRHLIAKEIQENYTIEKMTDEFTSFINQFGTD